MDCGKAASFGKVWRFILPIITRRVSFEVAVVAFRGKAPFLA